MRPGLRKLALAAHLSCSVGWLGAVAAYLALDLTVASSEDPPTVRAAWTAMDMVVRWAIVPLALAALLTGLVMALGTKWGLFRHWWVLISFLLTLFATLVLLNETRVITASAAIARDPSTSEERLLNLAPTLPHSIGGLMILLGVQVLNVYKPAGLTRYGWRKQQEERRRRAHRSQEAIAAVPLRGPD